MNLDPAFYAEALHWKLRVNDDPRVYSSPEFGDWVTANLERCVKIVKYAQEILTMDIDPELEGSLPAPFTLSIEPAGQATMGTTTYQHGYHLGTHEPIARAFAEEIWRRVNSTTGCYTVALMSEGEIFDVYDGRDWKSALDDKMHAEMFEDQMQAMREEKCPSKHYNDGTDICADCGAKLG